VDPRSNDGLPPAQRAWALGITGIGMVITMMDQAVVNMALPTIARDLHASASSSVWVLNAFQLALLTGMVPFSSLGDIIGCQRLFRIGMLAFAASSLCCVFAHDIGQLAAARVAQGLACSALAISTGPLNRLTFPAHMLGRATGYASMLVAVGAASGPIIGGAILSVASWQWLFAIYVPIGVVAYGLATWKIPHYEGRGGAFDWRSALLSGATFLPAVYGLDGIGHHLAPSVVIGSFVISLAFGWVFIRRQLGLPFPMYAVDLFVNPKFTLAVVTCYTAFVAQTTAYVALPFLFQTVMGRSPLEIGILFLPWLIATAALAPLAGHWADRIDASRLAAWGMGIFALGLALLMLLPEHAQPLDVIWRMLIAGAGYGIYQSPNNRSIQGSAPRERSGAPQGIQATARIFGQVTGAVACALVFAFATETNHAGGTDLHSSALVLGFAAAMATGGALASAWRGRLTSVRRVARIA
jgi:MFS transporter, DHA2 family, multidrug resistance protein